MLGGEPIVTRDGERIVDSHGRGSYVTSAGAGPSVGKHILLSYLPPEHANVGQELAVEYMTERYPVTVQCARLDAAVRPGQRAREGGGPDPGMRILVCVKRVPLTGGKMVLTADEQALETRHLGFTISPHEECGVEEAVRLVEEHGGEVTVLTLGPPEAEEQIRDSLANGGDRGVHLVTDGEEWDPQATAAAIVETIREEESAGGGFDLIVFGNESADAGNYQVGIRVAYSLGRPIANGLKGLSVADGRARCEQEVPGGRDIYELPLPAVVSVLEGINLPRYPSVPAKLRARSKPVEQRTPERPAAEAREAAPRRTARSGQAGRGAGHRPGRGTPGGRDHARDRGGRMTVLVLVEHDGGSPDELSLQALALARDLGGPVHALAIGEAVTGLGAYGVETLHLVEDDRLSAYAPAAWAACLDQLVDQLQPAARGRRGHEPGQRGARSPRRAPRSALRGERHRGRR